MKKLIVILFAMALAFTALLSSPKPAAAEEFTCVGKLGAVTVDNLRVPQGKSCTLVGTRVEGTIKVETRAKLYARKVRVIGNVQAEGAAIVNVSAGSRIGGSVQIVQGGSSQLLSSRINGDVQYFQNVGRIKIYKNTIGGNLQCKENRLAPTGGLNIVDGNKEDQCAGL